MNEVRCIFCGCHDIDPALDLSIEDAICCVCRDEYTVKPNRYKVLRLPYKVYRNFFGKVVPRDGDPRKFKRMLQQLR